MANSGQVLKFDGISCKLLQLKNIALHFLRGAEKVTQKASQDINDEIEFKWRA
jgi:hypothetical protein